MNNENLVFDDLVPRDLYDADISLDFDSPIIDMGGNQPKLYVVRGRRKRRPAGAMPILSIGQRVDLPAIREAVPVEDPRDICSQIPGSHGRQLIFTPTPNDARPPVPGPPGTPQTPYQYYIAPPNFSFAEMINEANRINTAYNNSLVLGIPALTGTIVDAEFFMLVRPGGRFDWKASGSNRFNPDGSRATIVDQGELVPIYEPFGNWTYGYFGSMLGYPPEVLLAGSALVQYGVNRGEDSVRDQNNIWAGIRAFQAVQASNGAAGGLPDPGDGSPSPLLVVIVQC